MQRKSVCVFCGSRPGVRDSYAATARDLGRRLARRGWRLVYGAGDVGLMGIVATAAQAGGGETLGVIPEHLRRREVAKTDLTQFVVTENMHERKKVMFMNSDAIVVLPGGPGTLDEFFEVLTWRQLGLHQKPVIVVSPDGYWQPLVDLVDHVTGQGFADAALRGFFQVVDSVATAEAELARALSA